MGNTEMLVNTIRAKVYIGNGNVFKTVNLNILISTNAPVCHALLFDYFAVVQSHRADERMRPASSSDQPFRQSRFRV